MFETSQEEPSGHDIKIIGGVIVVIMAVLGVLYYFYVHRALTGTETAQGGAATVAAGPADPVRDLAITNIKLGQDATNTMAMWSVTVSNRSTAHAYKNLQYSTNYFDAKDTLIYHNEGTIAEQVNPGEQRILNQINDGLYPMGVSRYTIEIKGAESVKP